MHDPFWTNQELIEKLSLLQERIKKLEHLEAEIDRLKLIELEYNALKAQFAESKRWYVSRLVYG